MKRKVAFITIISLAVLSLTLAFAFGNGHKTFCDLKRDHWAYQPISEMTESGIISGYPDGSFRPGQTVTYAEFIKMVAVGTGAVTTDAKARPGDHWAVPYYEAGLNNMYFSKWDIKNTAFDIPISRGNMALIVSGAMGDSVEVPSYSKVLDSISDVNVRTPNEFSIVKAYATGVLSGYPDGAFRPDGVLTRAEAASVIGRLVAVLEGESATTGPIYEKPKGSYREDINDLVAVEEDPPGFAKGTVDFKMFYYNQNTEARHAELLKELNARYPEQADAMYKAFLEFAAKPVPEGKQGMRKQYFGDYPVLMEHYCDTVGMYVLPISLDDPYWGIKPGQVYENFF